MNILLPAMKVILLTGSTDGIGLEAAKLLVGAGHYVLVHGRNPSKLKAVGEQLSALASSNATGGKVDTYQADFSNLQQVQDMASSILKDHEHIDVLVNNAGVFKSAITNVDLGNNIQVDQRLVVNTIAPYLLTKRLLPIISSQGGRIVNLSSAAQAHVDLNCLTGGVTGGGKAPPRALSHSEAYAQSKLGILQWTNALAQDLQAATGPEKGIVATAVNPASLIGTKMVQEAYGITTGKDLSIGADIIVQACLSKRFERASGKYFDNDVGDFRPPHPDGSSPQKNKSVQAALDHLLEHLGY
jgi:NAD(P)-dependent dehydrogenase (short-subunit alcohol dehydrogenase family)